MYLVWLLFVHGRFDVATLLFPLLLFLFFLIRSLLQIAYKFEGESINRFFRTLPVIKRNFHAFYFLVSPSVQLAVSRQHDHNSPHEGTTRFLDPCDTVKERVLRTADAVADENCNKTRTKLVAFEKSILDQLDW